MKSSHYLAIAVRLFAVVLFVYGLRQLSPFFELITRGTVSGVTVSAFFVLAVSIIPMLLSVILWFFPLSISNSILKPEMNREVAPLSQGDWLIVILIGVGLYTLYYGIVDLIYWLYFLHMSVKNYLVEPSLAMSGEDKANLAISFLEVAASLFLILKSKTISTRLLKIAK